MGFALSTAAFIAAFTLLDSNGARQSGHPYTYILWLFVLEGVLMLALAAVVSAPKLYRYSRSNGRTCLVNGAVMSIAHGLVIIALARTQPALVSALREVSIIFGVIFSAVFLNERVGPIRLGCAVAVTAGLFLTILG